MSPRIKTLRKILNPPVIKGYKPYGAQSPIPESDPVILLFEEYEALRLCDYDHYNHHKSSLMMGVSRPTFTRIYASALRKIAAAFVEGRQISIGGGKVYFDSDWHHCTKCSSYFNNPERDKELVRCPLCGDHHIIPYDLLPDADNQEHHEDKCVCPDCGAMVGHQPGNPCNRIICPVCKSFMRRSRKMNV